MSLRFFRHSSSQAADVGHACDRGTDSIMRHRPLSRWRSAIDLRLARVWSNQMIGLTFCKRRNGSDSTTLMGFPEPFAALILAHRVEANSSLRFRSRWLFDERLPRLFLSGIDRQICIYPDLLRGRSIMDAHISFRDHCPVAVGRRTDPLDRLNHAALGFFLFQVCRLPDLAGG